MRICGHEFDAGSINEPLVCNVCGMLYRDFLLAGGGCVVTNPPPRDATADTPVKESIALVIDGQEVGRIAVPDGVTVDAYSRYLQGVRYEIMDKLMPRAADTPATLVPHAYNPDTGVCVRCDADRSKIMNPDDPCYISGTLKERRRAMLAGKPKPASLPPMKFGPLVPIEYKPLPPDPIECECRTWAGDFSQMDGGHHVNCPHRPKPKPAGEATDEVRKVVSANLMKLVGKFGKPSVFHVDQPPADLSNVVLPELSPMAFGPLAPIDYAGIMPLPIPADTPITPGWYTPTPEAFGLPPAATSPERLESIRTAEELAVTVVRRFAGSIGISAFLTMEKVEIIAREVAREFMAQYYKE